MHVLWVNLNHITIGWRKLVHTKCRRFKMPCSLKRSWHDSMLSKHAEKLPYLNRWVPLHIILHSILVFCLFLTVDKILLSNYLNGLKLWLWSHFISHKQLQQQFCLHSPTGNQNLFSDCYLLWSLFFSFSEPRTFKFGCSALFMVK